MLNPDDAKVVATDTELPALRTILDDDAALALFAKHFPELEPTAARCTYLRYKPYTSCLAAFNLDTSEGERTFHIAAYGGNAADKLTKVGRANRSHDIQYPAPIIVSELAMVVSPFPYDKELPSLERVATCEGRVQLLSRLSAEDNMELHSAEWTTLRYKPERRFVARLEVDRVPRAVLKLHSEQVYAQSRRAAKSLGSLPGINTARPIGHSDRHRAILLEWLPGELLANLLTKVQLPVGTMREVGRLLARLHAQRTSKLPHRTIEAESQELHRSAEDLTAIAPSIEKLLNEVSRKITEQLSELPPVAVPIHGDCHPQQFLVDEADIAILDLDSAALGHPAYDVGNFLAHLERAVLQNRMPRLLGDQLTEELTTGYSERFAIDHQAMQTYLAAGLLRLAHEPFRYRQPDWCREAETLVEHANSILEGNGQRPKTITRAGKHPKAVKRHTDLVEVIDPFNVYHDKKLTNIDKGIDPIFASQTIIPIIKQTFEDESLELRSIRVLRHKLGRRCLIEYSCISNAYNCDITVLGKIHAKSKHERSYRLQQELWKSDFHYESSDGISVARPVGTVPECQMWLQERVSGISGWDALEGPAQETVATQISAAARKLHQTDILTERIHSIEDELQILEEKLPLVVRHSPRLKSRISGVLSACKELAASTPLSEPMGIHRDFYPDQIMFDGNRIYVLDHDLYCMGDPCLDIGNFNGHLIERSLRYYGHSGVYAASQSKLAERYCSLREDCNTAMIDAYTTLTVVRHIYLSTCIAGRRSSTGAILAYCERALALQSLTSRQTP